MQAEEKEEEPVQLAPDGIDPNTEINALTYAIIGAAQKVHRQLGPGFAELALNPCNHLISVIPVVF